MNSLANEFMKIAQNYSDFLEGTDWGLEGSSAFVPLVPDKGLVYSDLLEDTEWN